MTNENNNLMQVPQADEARVNVTFGGANGELPSPVPFSATDEQIRTWVAEAIQTGGVRGIPRSERADLSGFVIDRFSAVPEAPINRIMVRPKTGFGTR